MKKIILFLCLCIFAKADFYDYSKLSISENEFKELLKISQDKKLYKNQIWANLLHFSNAKSEIINDGFFYSKERNLKSEFEASLYNFFIKKDIFKGQKEELNQKDSALIFTNDNDNLHFRCKFPKRSDFIIKALDIKPKEELECSDLNNFIDYINPKSISIVFPAAYLNSPASMFGHTFLLVNTNYNSRLLSFAINWAADADEKTENMLAFSFKGLFGGYVGKYSLKPYYDMLKTYKDSENRDLYEYDLDFSAEESKDLLKHLWEIKDSEAEYLFLNKNCSYNILWLLENTRPNINLRDKFFLTVAPSNTIQKINEAKLIKTYHYRASKLNTILNQAKDLNFADIKDAKSISKGTIEPKNHSYKTLALANNLSQYYTSKGKLSIDEYKDISHKISSELSLAKEEKLREIPKKTSIILANYPAKIGVFYNKNYLLNFRPAMHDIFESDVGFTKGSGISFFDTWLEYDKKIKLKNIDFINLTSLSDFNYINHSLSYMLKIAYENNFNASLYTGFSKINEYFLASLLVGASYDKRFNINLKSIMQFSLNASKISFIYDKKFIKNKEDKISLKIYQQLIKNTALSLEYQKILKSSEEFKIGFSYYF